MTKYAIMPEQPRKTTMMGKLKLFFELLKETFVRWNDREPFVNSTVIAYYTIFSLPGLLVIVINIAGYFYGKDEVTTQLMGQIQATIGGNTANDIKGILATTSQEKATTLSTIIGIATLLFGATGVFYQLQQILNKMWEVRPKPGKAILKLITDRVFSFGLILAIGFLLVVSLMLSTALAAVSTWISGHLSESLNVIFKVVDLVFSMGVFTVLFAAIYKFLPDAKVEWKDVWHGALLTSVLFAAAKFALGLYFANSDPSSAYGAAGSVILIMLWVSYAGLIVLFGAEFTQTYASRYGKKIVPTDNAESTDHH